MPDVYKLQRYRGGWAISLYRDGVRLSRQKIPGDSHAAAKAEFTRILAAIGAPVTLPATVERMWELYREDRADRPIAENMIWTGKAILPHFGATMAEAVTIAQCRTYTAMRRAKGIHDGSIWTELGHLRTVLKWAEKHKHITAAPHIERPMKPDPKDRFLTREEAEKLIDGANMPHVRLAIHLMLGTAARVGAILDLTWDQVDFERGLIDLRKRDAKRRKGRAVVPMTDTLRAVLAEAKEAATTDHVIEWARAPVASIRNGFQAACRRAGLTGVSHHTTRHTAAVWMAEAGVPLSEIAAYLGHTNTIITQKVYAKHQPENLRKAANVLEMKPKLRVMK
jgi:integrase